MNQNTESPNLFNLINVLSGFPFSSTQFTDRNGMPLIRIRDLVRGKTETNFLGSFDTAYVMNSDDILIGMDGDFNVVRWKGPYALLNQRVCKISSTSSEIDIRFLYWWLIPHIKAIHTRTPQTTVRHLSVGDIYRIPKPAISSRAQGVVASVLDTIDEAMIETEAVITKLKQVRTGLLHDLLTCGLDENGQLRDPIAHPEQFKDSALGSIPKMWRASTLGAEMPLQRGFDITVAQQQSGDIPVVSSSGIASFHNAAMVKGPGVVTGRKGNLGKAYFIESDFWPHDTSLWVTNFKGNSEKYVALLLGYLRLERFDAATSVPTLNRNTVHPLEIAVPPRQEQELIISFLETFDNGIEKEGNWLIKLTSIKSGLMSDLLTGTVRVPDIFLIPCC